MFGKIAGTCVRAVGFVWLLSASLASGQNVIDFQADGIEVTQGIQDLNNSVRLVANRPTFVRFYAHIKSGATRAFADGELTIFPEGAAAQTFKPEFGALNLFTVMDRNTFFTFRIPEKFATGKVQFQAKVTTRAGVTDPDATNQAVVTALLPFETVPAPKVIVYSVAATDSSCNMVEPPADVASRFLEYSYLVMPISGMALTNRGRIDGNVSNADGSGMICGALWTANGSSFVLQEMRRRRIREQANNPTGFDLDERYFGFVSGNPNYFRGAALFPGDGTEGSSAAGPVPFDLRNGTGPFRTAARGYDMSGWVGAHELGHSYGLHHALNGCGEVATVNFPYANAFISPTTNGSNSDIFGFNILTQKSYLPNSKDFMSYCMDNPGQWISKQSYHRLMDSLINNWRVFPMGDKGWPANPAVSLLEPRTATGPAMLVSGIINLTAPAKSSLQPIVSATAPIPDPLVGTYSVVLKAGANEVGRTVLQASSAQIGPAPTGAPTPDNTLVFGQWIPLVAGATSVEIQGPGQQVFAARQAGAALPVVKITSPNGGENLTASTINIAWTASDADFNDRLVYEIALSGDNGATWSSITENVVQTTVTLPRTSFPACTQCLLRVTASDGIHSGNDVSDAVFTLPNQSASVQVLSPVAGMKGAIDLPVELAASVSDPDRPLIPDSAITWRSDIGGILGTGRRLSVLFPNVLGKHQITASILDGGVTVRSTPVEIEMVASVANLAAKDLTRLEADQSALNFAAGGPAQMVALTSLNTEAVLNWTATASQPWVQLGAAAGATPGALQVSLGNTASLPGGVSSAQVTIAAAGLPPVVIPVTLNKTAPAASLSIDPGGVVNSADYSYRISAGAITSAFGQGFATKVTQAAAVPLPKTLDGVSVEVIDGNTVTQAPLYFVSPALVNFQMPTQITSSSVRVRVKNAQGVTGEQSVQITRNNPTLFTREVTGQGHAVAVQIPNYVFVEPTSPLRPGDFVYFYVTGLGPVTPSIVEGNPAGDNAAFGPVNFSADTVMVKFAGKTFAPQFAGLAPGFVGVFQVNFQVPEGIDDTNCSIRVVANGVESQNGVIIPCRK